MIAIIYYPKSCSLRNLSKFYHEITILLLGRGERGVNLKPCTSIFEGGEGVDYKPCTSILEGERNIY